ncbi:hypothetical protein ACLOJK_003629, partial [Asimina triloba]
MIFLSEGSLGLVDMKKVSGFCVLLIAVGAAALALLSLGSSNNSGSLAGMTDPHLPPPTSAPPRVIHQSPSCRRRLHGPFFRR